MLLPSGSGAVRAPPAVRLFPFRVMVPPAKVTLPPAETVPLCVMEGLVTFNAPVIVSAWRLNEVVSSTETLDRVSASAGAKVTVPVKALLAWATEMEAPTALAVKEELPVMVRVPPRLVMPVAAEEVALRSPVMVMGPRSRVAESATVTATPLVTDTSR